MLVFLVFITAICYFIEYKRKRRRLEKIMSKYDGPPTIPILGNTEFYQKCTKDFIEKMAELTKLYKSPFRMWLANKPYIIVYAPLDFQVAANKTAQKDDSYKFIAENLGDGIFTSEGEKWKRHRRLISPVFHSNLLLENYLKIFNKNNIKLIKRLEKEECNGTHFDIGPYLMHTSLTTFCETSMGFENLTTDEVVKYGNAMKRATGLISKRFHSIWLMPSIVFKAYTYFFGYKKEFEAISNLPAMLLQKKKNYRSRIKGIRKYLHAIDEKDDSTKEKDKVVQNLMDRLLDFEEANLNFTKEHLFDEISSILFGGSETSAIMNGFTLMMLAMKTDIQDKVYEEIFNNFGDSNRLPRLDDLSKLSYLEQCIKETLRVFSIVPIVFRHTTQDIAISNGNIIPAGANIGLFIYKLHHNADIYSDPDKWNPKNFDPDIVSNRPSASFAAFSLGPRKCIGEKYAMIAMKAEISTILRNFKISTDLTMEEIKLDIDLILRSKVGYPLKLEYRYGKSLFS